MFDNLLAQPRLKEQLSRDLTAGEVPNALLFHGPAYSGKLTAGLELTRLLACTGDRSWTCPCSNCAQNRALTYPGLLIVGPKDHPAEIEAALQALLHKPDVPRRYLLLRAFRKLLKRFEPLLWEGEEAKLKGLADLGEKLAEDLDLLHPGSDPKQAPPLPEGEALVKFTEKLKAASLKLAGLLPASGLPIQMVRRLSFWARSTQAGGPKVILIEGAHTLLDAARNSLLKILEEPPEGAFFVLTTRHRSQILPTLLSRLRPYTFDERPSEAQRKVLAQIYGLSGPWPDLNDFFQSLNLGREGVAEAWAEAFWQHLEAGKDLPDWGSLDPSDHFRPLLTAIQNQAAQRLRHPGTDLTTGTDLTVLATLETLQERLAEALTRHETFNQNAGFVLETLFYGLRPR